MSAQGGEINAPTPIPSPKGVLSNDCRIQDAHVTVNNQTAIIRYTLVNDHQKPIDGVLTFYSPLFGWAGSDAIYSDKSFPELIVHTGTQSFRPTKHVAAFHDGIDVTRRLSSLGIDPLRVNLREDALLPVVQINRRAIASAIKDRLVTENDGLLTPNWYVQVSQAFHVKIAPTDEKQITIQYKLRPGFEPLQWSDKRLEALAAEHCTTIDQMKAASQDSGESLSDFVVAQTYKIPIGFGNAPLPQSVILDFIQTMPWSGLSPKASFICGGDGGERSVRGTPSFRAETSRMSDNIISALVILPQQAN